MKKFLPKLQLLSFLFFFLFWLQSTKNLAEKYIRCKKRVLVLTAFDGSFPNLDDLGEPFISVIRNKFKLLRNRDITKIELNNPPKIFYLTDSDKKSVAK